MKNYKELTNENGMVILVKPRKTVSTEPSIIVKKGNVEFSLTTTSGDLNLERNLLRLRTTFDKEEEEIAKNAIELLFETIVKYGETTKVGVIKEELLDDYLELAY